jgi:hypothetical protein
VADDYGAVVSPTQTTTRSPPAPVPKVLPASTRDNEAEGWIYLIYPEVYDIAPEAYLQFICEVRFAQR